MFDSCWLFLHRVNSHHYLYHHQNMDPRYASSKEKEPVRKVRIFCVPLLRLQRNKENSIWRSSLNVLFIGWSRMLQVISFLDCFAQYDISKDGFYCGSMRKRGQYECCKWKESHWHHVKRRDNSWHIDWYNKTMIEWPFIKLGFWKFVVSTNCNIYCVINSHQRVDIMAWIELT